MPTYKVTIRNMVERRRVTVKAPSKHAAIKVAKAEAKRLGMTGRIGGGDVSQVPRRRG